MLNCEIMRTDFKMFGFSMYGLITIYFSVPKVFTVVKSNQTTFYNIETKSVLLASMLDAY